MPAPVLVTGAGGCIGAWTVARLCESGAEVVAFDLSAERRRLALLNDDPAQADAVCWETGDVSDFERVREVFTRHRPRAVIHLAALQVPFCKADPVLGTRVNALGGVNIFEAARQCGAGQTPPIAYASSVAATAMGDNPWLETLYGASKIHNEQTARVYWQDWQVPSIGIRPSVVYGPARDRGMSAAPTVAMLAGVLRQPFVIPFTGAVGFVYAAEAAAAFIQAVSTEQRGAHVFNLNGVMKTVEEVVEMIRARHPQAALRCEGAPLPFPADMSDDPLRAHIGDYARFSFEDGLGETLALFARRVDEGRMGLADIAADKAVKTPQ